jgi:hypothetical protein
MAGKELGCVKEGFMCGVVAVRRVTTVLVSVARIRLMKTANPSGCVTVNSNLC